MVVEKLTSVEVTVASEDRSCSETTVEVTVEAVRVEDTTSTDAEGVTETVDSLHTLGRHFVQKGKGAGKGENFHVTYTVTVEMDRKLEQKVVAASSRCNAERMAELATQNASLRGRHGPACTSTAAVGRKPKRALTRPVGRIAIVWG